MRKRKEIVEIGKALLVLLCGIILVLGVGCGQKKGAELDQLSDNAVEGVNIEEQEDISRVVITTTRPATYSVYRPLQPVRIMVDISDAVLREDLTQELDVNNGTINSIKFSRISGEGNSITRVEIGLEDITGYEVVKEDNRLTVEVERLAGSKAVSSVEGPPMEVAPVPIEEGDILLTGGPSDFEEWADDEAAVGVPVPVPVGVEKPTAPAAIPVMGRADKLLDIGVIEKDDHMVINLITNGEVGDYNAFTIEKPSPKRIVLDLWNLDRLYPKNKLAVNSQGIKQIRIGRHPDKLRLVFDVSSSQIPSFNFEKANDRLTMTVSTQITVAQPAPVPVVTQVAAGPGAEEWEPIAPGEAVEPMEGLPEPVPFEPVPVPIEPVPVPIEPGVGVPLQVMGPAGARIESIEFKYTPSASSVVIKSSTPVKYTRRENPEDKIVSILVHDAFLPPELERSYDTTEFQSPVDLISSFQSGMEPPEVNVTISLNTMAPSSVSEKGNVITISFENVSGVPGLVGAGMDLGVPGEEIGVPGAEEVAEVTVRTYEGEEKVYRGAPIYLDAKGMEVLDALRLIAEVSGYNIIASDDVKGTLTMKLDNVPWDQALDLILQTKELGYVKMGNIYRIAPLKKIRSEQQEAIAQQQSEELLKPIQVKVIPINYNKAMDVQRNLRKFLSDRGSVEVDRRTNSIIVRDTQDKLEEIMQLVSSIDQVTPAVLIEARIVEATTGFARNIGVLWSWSYNMGPKYGNPTGLNFPNTIQYNQAILGGGATATSPIALAGLSGQGSAGGISFGSLTGSFNLDLVLKTFETQNKINIISSPRILTLQDERATIQQGVTIPYPPAVNLAAGGGGGQQWQFVEAALRLEVTPHITADRSIVMDLKVSNNEPNQKVVSGGSPSIDKKEAQTTILLKDGETAVIGGIYKIRESEAVNKVPFLGSLPLIGRLFQDKATDTSKNELLVFITPRIIEAGKQVTGL